MANDYLISKWRKWFTLFDNNKDGKVCYADMELARSRFTELHHMEGERKKSVNERFTKWWCEYVLCGSQELTEDEFVEKLNAAFKANKGKFIERIQKCQNEIGGIIDVAQDGFISEDEMLAIFKAEGHADEGLDKTFFAEFKPVDGKVPLDKMLEYWIHFLTFEDSSIPNPVQKAFEGGL